LVVSGVVYNIDQLGERIRQIRQKRKMTQDVFVQLLGITRGHLSTIETGRAVPSNQLIKSICREYKVNEKWLRYGEEPMFVEQVFKSLETPVEPKVAYTDQAVLELVKIINRKDKEIARVKRRLKAYDKLILFLEGRIDMLEEELQLALDQKAENRFEA